MKEKDGSTYKGEVPEGEGSLLDKEGSYYKGRFELGVLNGEGTKTVKDGTVYKANFLNGKINENFDVEVNWTDGSHYVGQWKSKPHGKGLFKTFDENNQQMSLNGVFEEGNFKSGTAKFSNGLVLEGNFENSDLSNSISHNFKLISGKMVFPNGDVYQGEFENGLPDGEGVLQNEDGEFFVGVFKEGHLVDGSHFDESGDTLISSVNVPSYISQLKNNPVPYLDLNDGNKIPQTILGTL